MANNKWLFRIITSVLLLPLFFINVKDSHDWGDDFAQYLIQARNIVEHKPQTENGLLFNDKYQAYAIKAYPAGFPILISPLYYFFGMNIKPYSILISTFLFFAGLICFELMRKQSTPIIASLISMLFSYNLTMLTLKKEIISEIPFTCLLLFLALWPSTKFYKNKYSWIITGIILCSLVSIRLIGITALFAYILFALYNLRKEKENKERLIILRTTLLSCLSGFALFMILNSLLFPTEVGNLFGFYSTAFHDHTFQGFSNMKFYYEVSNYVFTFFNSWVPSYWILIAIAGWMMKCFKTPTISEFIFPLYSLFIILYPYSNAGTRFIIPVLPFLIFYACYFFYTIFRRLEEKAWWASTVFLILAVVACLGPLKNIVSHQGEIEDGPQLPAAKELFAYLKSTQSNSAIVFCKARAMSLYSGHPSLYTGKEQTPEQTLEQFHRYDSLYLVVTKAPADNEIYDQRLLDFVSRFSDQYEKVWENSWFTVYMQDH